MMNNTIDYAAAKKRTTIGNFIFDAIIFIVLAFVVIVTVYPFWNTIAISLNDGLNSFAPSMRADSTKLSGKPLM